jgi:hypothetical protein
MDLRRQTSRASIVRKPSGEIDECKLIEKVKEEVGESKSIENLLEADHNLDGLF